MIRNWKFTNRTSEVGKISIIMCYEQYRCARDIQMLYLGWVQNLLKGHVINIRYMYVSMCLLMYICVFHYLCKF